MRSGYRGRLISHLKAQVRAPPHVSLTRAPVILFGFKRNDDKKIKMSFCSNPPFSSGQERLHPAYARRRRERRVASERFDFNSEIIFPALFSLGRLRGFVLQRRVMVCVCAGDEKSEAFMDGASGGGKKSVWI